MLVGWKGIYGIYIYKSISLYLGVISLHLGVMISTSPSNGSKVIYSPIVYIYMYIFYIGIKMHYIFPPKWRNPRAGSAIASVVKSDRFSGQLRS